MNRNFNSAVTRNNFAGNNRYANRYSFAGNQFGRNGWNRGYPYGGGYGGFGRYGFGGYPYLGLGRGWGYGYGYRPYGFGWGLPLYGFGLGYGLGGLGYGLGYGLGGYGSYGYGNGYYGGNYVTSYPVAGDQVVDTSPPAATDPFASATFAERGEAAFKAGNYTQAATEWQHALVDDPQNGTLGMMYAQALFASGQYDQAAGATQTAMSLLPADQWGVVVKNYKELYPDAQRYTDQLRALEKARNDKTSDPALRFLLGFQYQFLGYPTQATRELTKAVELAPQDELARQLLSTITGQPPAVETLPATPLPAPGT